MQFVFFIIILKKVFMHRVPWPDLLCINIDRKHH